MNWSDSFYAGQVHLNVYPELVQESLPDNGIRTPFGSRQPIGSTALLEQIRQGKLRPYPHETYRNRQVTIPCQATAQLQPLPGFPNNLSVVGYGPDGSQPGALVIPADGKWQPGDPSYWDPVEMFLQP